MVVEKVDILNLVLNADNSRTHSATQIKQVMGSISEFGFCNPILIGDKNQVIAGHARLAAAQRLGLDKVPGIFLKHLNDDQVRALSLADNRIAENAGWDSDLLIQELCKLDENNYELDILGFTAEEIGKYLDAGIEKAKGLTHEDEVPDVDEQIFVKLSDIWELGEHVLVCGDSLELKTIRQLFSNDKDDVADMVFTDPPYLMNFQGSLKGDGTKSANGNHAPIKNDKLSKKEGQIFLENVCNQIKAHCSGAWYVSFYRLGIDWLFEAMKNSGLKWRNQIIWEKGHLNLSNSDHKSIYEPVITGWSDDYTPVFYGWNENHKFYGSKGETDCWEMEMPSIWHIPRTSHNDLHPTMKPVALVERTILNSSLPKQRVLDLFGGAGATIIACEKNCRKARVAELEPKYCQVTIKRWQDYTGQDAIRHDGLNFNELCLSN